MGDLYPTKTRVELLRAVAAGHIYSEWGNEYDRSRRHLKVTARMTQLVRAGWVRVGTDWSRQSCELTEAGRKVLEEAAL